MAHKYRIFYLPVAQGDLIDIFQYIQEDDPEAAARFVDRIDKAVSKLERHPKLGSVPADERLGRLGYRMLVVNNYIVFYVVKKSEVEVRRVVHGKRRYTFLIE